MAELALIEEVHELATIRRFELPDLSQHGPWLLRRFAVKFPDYSEKEIAGYLSRLIYNNETLFLYQDNAVALAQFAYGPGVRPAKIVQESFVWAKDKNDRDQLEYAADFYTHIKEWAKQQGVERLVVLEDSDVPKSMIEARLGRIFDTKI